jgi:serine/threonine-protein phosphatase 2A regulatory subunit A
VVTVLESSIRVVADHLYQPLLEHFAQPHILSDGLPIYRKLQQDEQDSVRLLTVEDLIVIAKRLTPAEIKEQLLRQIRQSIGDKSWRVRYMAANHFNELSEALGVELVREELIGQYVQLLKDNEAEVRSAASTQIPGNMLFQYH